MSEEKFNQIENQISTLQQDMTALKHNIEALRGDMTSLRLRVESFEVTILVAMREGFNSLRNYLDDLNYEVADNARATRLLKRRVARLERKDDN